MWNVRILSSVYLHVHLHVITWPQISSQKSSWASSNMQNHEQKKLGCEIGKCIENSWFAVDRRDTRFWCKTNRNEQHSCTRLEYFHHSLCRIKPFRIHIHKLKQWQLSSFSTFFYFSLSYQWSIHHSSHLSRCSTKFRTCYTLNFCKRFYRNRVMTISVKLLNLNNIKGLIHILL